MSNIKVYDGFIDLIVEGRKILIVENFIILLFKSMNLVINHFFYIKGFINSIIRVRDF